MEHDSINVKKAIEWISENLKSDPETSIKKWINKAEFQFDLNPKQSEFLYSFYKDALKNKEEE